ncbi:aldo/keto reductase [Nonomuraea sp. NPDC049419]|uniref:aldo/keto reductase n=1 Tax=Nonomuraea sp. NPDC049419 TaxID=3155772 RepID=UPI00343F9583
MDIALGTIPFGTSVGMDETFAILDRYHEAGGTRIDTANNYPFWVEGCSGDESELAVGAWLAARGTRDEMVISTKVGARPTVPGDVTLDSAEGLTAEVIAKGVEGSLQRLGTDRIDVYWAHVDDRDTPLEETLGAFDAVVRAGKARAIGASNMAAWRLERARNVSAGHGWTPYSYLQLRHTYLRPRPGSRPAESGHRLVNDDTLDYLAAEPGITLWAYNTLMFGAYTREDRPIPDIYHHPGTTRRLAALREVAGELGATPNQVVLAWLIGGGVVPIVGVSTMEQLEEAIGGARLTLDAELRARLDAIC